MLKKTIIPILLLSIFYRAYCAECLTYCAVTKGNDLEFSGEILYVASDGGLIEYDNGSAEVYDIDDGLFKPSVACLEKDFMGFLWLGHSDCSVTVYDTAKKRSQYLNDIELSGVYTLNRIYSSGKFVYIATDGLLARYKYNSNFKKFEISDTNLMTGEVMDVSVFGGSIYIAAAPGIYVISENSANINDLSLWSSIGGLDPNTTVNSFVSSEGTLYALTSNGIYSITGTAAQKKTAFSGNNVYSGTFYDGKFYASFQDVGAVVVASCPADISGTAVPVHGSETVGELKTFSIKNGKIYYPADGGYSYFEISTEDEGAGEPLNLPVFDRIKKILLTADGKRLVYMAARNMAYMDLKTRYFDPATAQSSLDVATNLVESSDGSIYTGTWGNGVRKFKFDNNTYSYEKTYSFGSALTAIRYPVHPGLSKDTEGNIWVTNWDDKRPDSVITVIGPTGQVRQAFNTENFTSGYDIFVDRYKDLTWVWLGSSRQSFGTLDGLGVGKYDGNSLSVKQISLNEGVIDIIRDKDGIVWIGTNNGIKYIDLKASPSDPLSLSATHINSVISGPVGSFIYDIEVNSINEKWFATDKGVSVLSPDNSVWRHYVTKYFSQSSGLQGEVIRTNLIDPSVTDIEFDEKNGIAVLASENGLVFLEYGRIFKSNSLPGGELQTKPSPFLNDGSEVMGFYFPDDGNSYDTAKIFDLSGLLIRGGEGGKELKIQNGWDGRNNDGKLVSSGIYQVICYSKSDRTKNITGKIAVVRK